MRKYITHPERPIRNDPVELAVLGRTSTQAQAICEKNCKKSGASQIGFNRILKNYKFDQNKWNSNDDDRDRRLQFCENFTDHHPSTWRIHKSLKKNNLSFNMMELLAIIMGEYAVS